MSYDFTESMKPLLRAAERVKIDLTENGMVYPVVAGKYDVDTQYLMWARLGSSRKQVNADPDHFVMPSILFITRDPGFAAPDSAFRTQYMNASFDEKIDMDIELLVIYDLYSLHVSPAYCLINDDTDVPSESYPECNDAVKMTDPAIYVIPVVPTNMGNVHEKFTFVEFKGHFSAFALGMTTMGGILALAIDRILETIAILRNEGNVLSSQIDDFNNKGASMVQMVRLFALYVDAYLSTIVDPDSILNNTNYYTTAYAKIVDDSILSSIESFRFLINTISHIDLNNGEALRIMKQLRSYIDMLSSLIAEIRNLLPLPFTISVLVTYLKNKEYSLKNIHPDAWSYAIAGVIRIIQFNERKLSDIGKPFMETLKDFITNGKNIPVVTSSLLNSVLNQLQTNVFVDDDDQSIFLMFPFYGEISPFLDEGETEELVSDDNAFENYIPDGERGPILSWMQTIRENSTYANIRDLLKDEMTFISTIMTTDPCVELNKMSAVHIYERESDVPVYVFQPVKGNPSEAEYRYINVSEHIVAAKHEILPKEAIINAYLFRAYFLKSQIEANAAVKLNLANLYMQASVEALRTTSNILADDNSKTMEFIESLQNLNIEVPAAYNTYLNAPPVPQIPMPKLRDYFETKWKCIFYIQGATPNTWECVESVLSKKIEDAFIMYYNNGERSIIEPFKVQGTPASIVVVPGFNSVTREESHPAELFPIVFVITKEAIQLVLPYVIEIPNASSFKRSNGIIDASDSQQYTSSGVMSRLNLQQRDYNNEYTNLTSPISPMTVLFDITAEPTAMSALRLIHQWKYKLRISQYNRELVFADNFQITPIIPQFVQADEAASWRHAALLNPSVSGFINDSNSNPDIQKRTVAVADFQFSLVRNFTDFQNDTFIFLQDTASNTTRMVIYHPAMIPAHRGVTVDQCTVVKLTRLLAYPNKIDEIHPISLLSEYFSLLLR